MDKAKILIVDDEEDLCRILQFNLENEGYIVELAYSGEEALRKIDESFHLVLLDVMMGGISGFETAKQIRYDKKMSLPILFLTAKNAENDVLTGFSLGADDYITKPFSIKEVNVRVKSILARCYSKQVKDVKIEQIEFYEKDGLKIDLLRKDVFINGQAIQLTKREFEILKMLIQFPDRVFSREDILACVWPEGGCVLDRTVDVHVTRLRKKMGEYGVCIKNRSGYGYFFVA
ncbi:MAG: response regulator transcription factor [Bacteroidales bacterium]